MQISKILSTSTLVLILSLAACGGGGGGGGDSDTKGNGGNSNTRTTKTAVRLINASVDAVPLGISSNGVYLYQTSYMGETSFAPIAEGPGTLTISVGPRVTEVLRAFNIDALPQTEYTILYYGADKDGNVNHRAFVEPLVRPVKGSGRIQVLHGLSDVSSITADIATIASPTVSFGQTSGFVDVPAGTHTVTVRVTRGGVLVQPQVTIPDQGEVTLVVSGKLDYDFVTVKAYEDLD